MKLFVPCCLAGCACVRNDSAQKTMGLEQTMTAPASVGPVHGAIARTR